ncbi:MAG: hypothetical protein U9N49_11470 [Campylobacterota bacterium]|nr:hypothetical protein [Campylobacterota bacterium]
MEKIDVVGATVEFFKSIEEGVTTYRFDTSSSKPPAPMVNAMAGLQLLDENSRLVMINRKSPEGLFPKVQDEFDFSKEPQEDGTMHIIFRRKKDATNTTDFSQTSCSGGKCSH